ncbi:High-affinity branched-chain amino acid transport system permease protein LivH [uncultured spirochete]|jgi:branched-chain amino acid transport system permease protein|uniref:High-affinity branched-chain amino acid transport system permease protein LivH n=2 Tax=Spirochaetales TaxID=136 RepID=A0A3P3XKZ6_9SPIR|nr:High-affinity branched-chain amino acid transport system permease protein LivH [uncultured spirochete]HBE46147.1 branched-chain amino acid ABC transporter permease [Spirochaetaceae bacterium]
MGPSLRRHNLNIQAVKMAIKQRKAIIFAISIATAVVLILWKPTVLIYGLQAAGLYAAVAIPMGLVLGIVHIVNLSHGEFMMLASYATYTVCRALGVDPLIALIPAALVTALFGWVVFQLTIRRALKAPELNQLILTFGLAIAFSQIINLIFTSQTYKLSLEYSSMSLDIGDLSFGVWSFVFVAVAVIYAVGLQMFLTKTRTGKAALAVGQNPKGAAIVGIDVYRTYGLVFALAIGLVGAMGALFLTKSAIFPGVGSPFTMKSFSLVAMAGIGNIPGILGASVLLGLAENFLRSFRGTRDWAEIVYFVLIIAVILSRSLKGKKS